MISGDTTHNVCISNTTGGMLKYYMRVCDFGRTDSNLSDLPMSSATFKGSDVLNNIFIRLFKSKMPSRLHTCTHKRTFSNPHFHTDGSWLFAYFLCLEEQVDFQSLF